MTRVRKPATTPIKHHATPKRTSQNNAHNTKPTMGNTSKRKLHRNRTGADDRLNGDDDGPGGNVGLHGGDVSGQEGEATTPKTKKQKELTDKTPTAPKPKDGNDDGATTTGGAMNEKNTEDGIGVVNNGNATDNKGNESVSKPGFSYLE